MAHKIKISALSIWVISIGISLSQSLCAQSLSGYVLNINDSTPIPGVHLTIQGTVRATSQSPSGSFLIDEIYKGKTVTVSHIGFDIKKVNLSEPNTTIYLSPKIHQLNSVNISSKPFINIIADKKMYIIDFAFYKNQLLAISLNNRKDNNANLVLINQFGDTNRSTAIENPEFLFTDCFNNQHLIEKNIASQIFVDSIDIKLLFPAEKEYFINTFEQIIGYSNGRFLIRKDHFANQVVEFIIVNSIDTSSKILTVIADEAGLERLSDRGRLEGSIGFTEHDARFEAMCFYSKKDLYTIIDNDLIMIFNTVSNKIEEYDFDGSKISETDFDFHLRKDWDKIIIRDDFTHKIYAQFTKNGITTLSEIDKKNGQLINHVTIPGINFAQKIKINDHKIYFLYNDPANGDYKQLFAMNIDK